MDLFNDEEILKPKKKMKIKASTVILVLIVLLSILLVLTIVAIVYFRASILKISIDGMNGKALEEILIIEENNKIYMPIKRMAEFLNYDAYNGDYITRSEDPTKCYIETEKELVSFTLNSNILTKVTEGQTQQINITEPIKEINGELCITAEGAQDAYNFIFHYDKEAEQIYIQTLSYLYNGYSGQFQAQGYVPIEEETFENKTAILDGMLIVKSQNEYYGVITTSGESILETKYDSINYLRKTSDFLVDSNGKKGIISASKETKVQLIYDDIKTVSNKNDIFYVIESEGLYGLLDAEGNTIIYPEYEQIGTDVTSYSQNGVTNGYILYNQIVPVKRNNKWALFNINGNRVTEFIYDSLGCPSNQSGSTRKYGVIKILDYNLIVGCQSGKYNLITLEGKPLFSSSILDSVYITISQGKNVYYITSGTTTKELISFLQENGVTKPIPIE